MSASARVGQTTPCQAGGLKIVEAEGPNAGGSFTTKEGERTVTMRAEATGGCSVLADSVRWDVRDAPNDAVASVPPNPALLGRGLAVAWDVPVDQDKTRWPKTQHPGTLREKSLAFEVIASVVDDAGHKVESEADTVGQDEIDTAREEYVDYQGAGLYRGIPGRGSFSAHDHNTGDYGVAVVNAQFDRLLMNLQSAWPEQFQVNSIYRNPVHQWYHLKQPIGASWHSYGCAADVQTFPHLSSQSPPTDTLAAVGFWRKLAKLARNEGFIVESLVQSGVGHVHADIHCVGH